MIFLSCLRCILTRAICLCFFQSRLLVRAKNMTWAATLLKEVQRFMVCFHSKIGHSIMQVGRRYYEAGASFDIYLRSHRYFLSDTKSRFTMLLINDNNQLNLTPQLNSFKFFLHHGDFVFTKVKTYIVISKYKEVFHILNSRFLYKNELKFLDTQYCTNRISWKRGHNILIYIKKNEHHANECCRQIKARLLSLESSTENSFSTFSQTFSDIFLEGQMEWS